jgi:trk system potassium uptake protein TrkH
MNFKAILRLLSVLLLLISLFLFISFLIGIYYQEPVHILKSFLIPILISIVFFVGMFLLSKEKEIPYLSPRSGFLFVALSWISASALGALPFCLSGSIPTYTDSFFETMSGFTTTGASILTEIEILPKSILFWRSTTHWLGGMGIVVLTVAIFPLLGFGGLHLMEAEAPGPSVDKITPRVAGTAKILWLIYVGFTVAEIILLLFGGMDLFDAITHTFGTMATGGFSPKNASVGHYKSVYVDIVITVFMLIAGMNFSLYYKLLRGQIREVLRDSEMKTYLAIFFIASLLIAVDLTGKSHSSFGESFRYAAFQAASILTTTGFVTENYMQWSNFAQVVLLVLFFIGGCAGSTGGGIKVIRIVTLFKMSLTEMKYLVHPRGVFGIFVNGQYLKKNIVYDIAALVFLYFATFFVVTVLVATGGYDIMTSVGAAIATLGNIGPGWGKVGPVFNYAFFPSYIKWILSLAMVIGRLEVYTIMVLFTPTLWKH